MIVIFQIIPKRINCCNNPPSLLIIIIILVVIVVILARSPRLFRKRLPLLLKVTKIPRRHRLRQRFIILRVHLLGLVGILHLSQCLHTQFHLFWRIRGSGIGSLFGRLRVGLEAHFNLPSVIDGGPDEPEGADGARAEPSGEAGEGLGLGEGEGRGGSDGAEEGHGEGVEQAGEGGHIIFLFNIIGRWDVQPTLSLSLFLHWKGGKSNLISLYHGGAADDEKPTAKSM
mmetsp:Transcript_23077/g.39473  ORF Transcript_23077/g.39473 Transcript_23077/m.39473 type:complete len:228 (-) Transcript_23077:10-693(-)